MINEIKGDLLKEVTNGIIVHGCNAQGVMGSGFAKQLKETYPEAYNAYREHYKENYAGKNILRLGECIGALVTPDILVINAVTQQYYGRERKRYVDYDAVRKCFKQIAITACRETERRMNNSNEHIQTFAEFAPSINFPMIGAGLGGGDWDIISQIIDEEIPDDFQKNLWVLP